MMSIVVDGHDYSVDDDDDDDDLYYVYYCVSYVSLMIKLPHYYQLHNLSFSSSIF